jgi:hypothetical protein
LINADINGAGNSIRKVAPKAFKGVEDGKASALHSLVVHPVRLVVTPSQNQKGKSKRESKHLRERYRSLYFLELCRFEVGDAHKMYETKSGVLISRDTKYIFYRIKLSNLTFI